MEKWSIRLGMMNVNLTLNMQGRLKHLKNMCLGIDNKLYIYTDNWGTYATG